MAVTSAASPTVDSNAEGVDAPELRLFVMALFFIFGGITSLNDVIIPKLKELFTLNYTQAMLVQFCFFTAYLVIGIPGATLAVSQSSTRSARAGAWAASKVAARSSSAIRDKVGFMAFSGQC